MGTLSPTPLRGGHPLDLIFKKLAFLGENKVMNLAKTIVFASIGSREIISLVGV